MSSDKRLHKRAGVLILLLVLVAGAGWLARSTRVSPGQSVLSAEAGQGHPALSTQPGAEGRLVSTQHAAGVQVGHSYKNDVSPPLRTIKPALASAARKSDDNENPPIILKGAANRPDTAVQRTFGLPGSAVAPSMPAPVSNWAGIGSMGAGGGGCN